MAKPTIEQLEKQIELLVSANKDLRIDRNLLKDLAYKTIKPEYGEDSKDVLYQVLLEKESGNASFWEGKHEEATNTIKLLERIITGAKEPKDLEPGEEMRKHPGI